MPRARRFEPIQLKNAPIVGAVLDFRLRPEAPPAASAFEKFHKAIGTKYPNKAERKTFQAGFEFGGRTSANVAHTFKGYQYTSEESKYIVQAEVDGFALHHTRRYEEFESFQKEFRECWDLYQDVIGPARITRIGLRYINRLELPMPFNDFKEFILTGPIIADKLPQSISELFMRVILPDPELEATAIVTQTILPVENQNLPLIFDIDTFRQTNLAIGDAAIWSTLDDLRMLKNDIFFGSLTKRAIELFQ